MLRSATWHAWNTSSNSIIKHDFTAILKTRFIPRTAAFINKLKKEEEISLARKIFYIRY